MMRALVLDAESCTANVRNVPTPKPAADELLIKVEYIALNPIDPLYVAHPLGRTGRVVGSDFAGYVVEIGSYGDRVAGFLQGACSVNDRPGAFAEFLTIQWDLIWRIPDTLTSQQAAGVSLVALTAAQGIWYRLGLEAPFTFDREAVLKEHPEWQHTDTPSSSKADLLNVFIYGASTSVALYAAQMARLSAKVAGKNIKLFGTASKTRWGFLKSHPYKYDYLVDYHYQDWPMQIIDGSSGIGMHYAYDSLSEGDSVQRVTSTLTHDGQIAVVRSRQGGAWKAGNLLIEPIYGAVWEGLGEEVQYQGLVVDGSVAARDFTVKFYKWLSRSLNTEIHVSPVRIMPGGLGRVVEDGFQLLGAGGMNDRKINRTEPWMGPVSAEKLVYKV